MTPPITKNKLITVISQNRGLASEVAVPLNLLVTGDQDKTDNTSLGERHVAFVNNNKFNLVIAKTRTSLNFNVKKPKHGLSVLFTPRCWTRWVKEPPISRL